MPSFFKPKSMKYIWSLLFALVTVWASSQELPQWQEGYLDIHHINTGRGDCTFCILPDGSTMLIDAGDNNRANERVVAAKPDTTRRAGEWIADYIRFFIPHNKKSIDYYLLTHYHADHIGSRLHKKESKGRYYLTGISEVYQSFPANVIVDRGDDFMPPSANDPCYANYHKFINTIAGQSKRETFSVGSCKQFRLCHEPEKYPSFYVRNIYANGKVWNGKAGSSSLFPARKDYLQKEMPRENMYSCVIKLSYGSFDYYTGGDIPGFPRPGRPKWHDIETPVTDVVGKVEVAVLNHHGYEDGTNENFLRNLSPRNIIMSTWDALHPNHTVLHRLFSKEIYPEERNVFSTNMHPATKIVIGDIVNRMISHQGHIMVRVYPGGDEYRIYVFNDAMPISESCVLYKSEIFKNIK